VDVSLQTAIEPGPFQIPLTARTPIGRTVMRTLVKPSLDRLLCLPALNSRYLSIAAERRVNDFLNEALASLGVQVDVSPADLARIPAAGPVLVVANHPFGGLEGIALAALLRRVRPDVKLMANYMLQTVPEMRQHLIAVDPFGRADSAKRNIGPLKEAVRWMRSGGLLGIFPAGEVSSLDLRKRAVTDPAWNPAAARMARMAKATVLPVYFHGDNGPFFNLLGLLHPRMRTVLLPRQLLNKQNTTLRVAIGSPIPFSRLDKFEDEEKLTDYLRLRAYILRNRFTQGAAFPALSASAPLAGAAPALLRAEIESLPASAVLADNGQFSVVSARGAAIPNLLNEIGRLREESFREVGEGTGRDLDLDAFDPDYDHLILWHKGNAEIAGAYRIGRADELLARKGAAGLYTATLFKYKKEFLTRIAPALELGRAFVRREYRKSYAPLLMLWKGIGAYVARQPHYRFLFGPVSISSAYHPFSQALMMRFLETRFGNADLTSSIKPKNPPKRSKASRPGGLRLRDVSELCQDVEDLSGLVAEIEQDGKGVPVLLRQYLKLGGHILTFNLDHGFGDAIDGLMLIDLTQTPQKTLEKYMGSDQAQAFLAQHGR
jgi:putative hemolysin